MGSSEAGPKGLTGTEPAIADQAKRLVETARRFRIKIVSLMNNVLSRGRLNLPQYNALSTLVLRGPFNMSQLAEALCVSTAAATNVVDKLVQLGLVRRGRGEHDRRVVLVKPTAKGRRTVEAVERDVMRFFTRLLHSLSEEEREQFVTLYERLNSIVWDEALEVG